MTDFMLYNTKILWVLRERQSINSANIILTLVGIWIWFFSTHETSPPNTSFNLNIFYSVCRNNKYKQWGWATSSRNIITSVPAIPLNCKSPQILTLSKQCQKTVTFMFPLFTEIVI